MKDQAFVFAAKDAAHTDEQHLQSYASFFTQAKYQTEAADYFMGFPTLGRK